MAGFPPRAAHPFDLGCRFRDCDSRATRHWKRAPSRGPWRFGNDQSRPRWLRRQSCDPLSGSWRIRHQSCDPLSGSWRIRHQSCRDSRPWWLGMTSPGLGGSGVRAAIHSVGLGGSGIRAAAIPGLGGSGMSSPGAWWLWASELRSTQWVLADQASELPRFQALVVRA